MRSLSLVLVLLGLVCASAWPGCVDLSTDEPCDETGAIGLREEHEQILECAGYLDFVRSNVGLVTYVEAVTIEVIPDTLIVGRAFCTQCEIKVATLRRRGALAPAERTPLQIASYIVHEAYHLYEGCALGEENALRAELDFLRTADELLCR